jgi:hypothetical protein
LAPCAPRVLRDLRTPGADVDRHLLIGAVVNRRVARVVVLAVKRDRLLGPQEADQLDRLTQPGKALLVVGPRDAERAFVQMLARANAEDHAVGEQRSESPESLRHDGGVISKGRSHNRGAERNALGPLSSCREPGHCKGRVPIGVTPRLEVVADEHALETVLFGGDSKIEQLPRAELLGRSLIAEAQHL